ncbi:helix-turn-helix domain-containing protein [Dyella acidiphila]|uniref:Helix-turn-helix transcriptional regulator n=1 Tax=Dyella acidiphila TaxID=2775866 RepID=A0ABR9GFG2_9GAMM|nr:helix-turn-helix transcriptional regulator [Dyella acidiphila]MBE1162763.1 helix-turn-helix transcriptional regulator [Dyella acidiphila]
MKRKSIHSVEHRELVTYLSDLRHQTDMTQEEVAAAMGCQQTYVSAIESGRRGVDMLQVREFCAVYDITLPEFATEFEERVGAAVGQKRPPKLSPRKRSTAKKTTKNGASRDRSKPR